MLKYLLYLKNPFQDSQSVHAAILDLTSFIIFPSEKKLNAKPGKSGIAVHLGYHSPLESSGICPLFQHDHL